MNADFLMSENEIDLVFQPIVSVSGREVYSYETLVRFANKRMADTQQTINLIEGSGRALLLDRRVSLKLLSCINNQHFLNGVPLSLNVTGQSVSSKTFLNWFEVFIDRVSHPERLIIEITESLPINDLNQAMDFFRFCRQKGIPVTLDDYGTGHSNSDRLQEFRFRGAKLDGCYVKDWHTKESALNKASELIDLSSRLGLTTTAEFVGSTEDIKKARSLGFHNVQGQIISMPCEHPDPPHQLLQKLNAQGIFDE